MHYSCHYRFSFVYGMRPSLSWLWGIPLIAIGQVIFTFGVSIIFSTLNLFFRDLERFVTRYYADVLLHTHFIRIGYDSSKI